ncbi:MAG TPA: hypothetical protein VNZ52_11815 [Candidatus Thermoplasmatota archaeon]|nr:hypothetical protein [Candidatus Thermoplasmatota archaeon]
MGDAVKAAEDALFGAWNWVAENLGDLQDVPEEADALVVVEELLRAYTHLAAAPETALGTVDRKQVTEAADQAAMVLVEMEAELHPDVLARLAPVRSAREALLELEDPRAQGRAADPFLQAFDAAWNGGRREGLIFDAGLAAVLHGNLMPRLTRDPAEKRRHLLRAAELYDSLAAELGKRMSQEAGGWGETLQQATNRAAVARRAAGGL